MTFFYDEDYIYSYVSGARSRNRTDDLLITNQLLCLLSYPSVFLRLLRFSVRVRTMYMRVNAITEIPAVKVVDKNTGSVFPH